MAEFEPKGPEGQQVVTQCYGRQPWILESGAFVPGPRERNSENLKGRDFAARL